MLITKSFLNTTLNHVHNWGEPEQHPMKRMFLSRLGAVACGTIEVSGVALSLLKLGIFSGQGLIKLASKAAHLAFPKSDLLLNQSKRKFPFQSMKEALVDTCKLIIGVASTIFLGVVFSPEINFRLHIKLGLAIDNLALKKQKEINLKLQAEANAAEITKARAERFARFEVERKAAKNVQAEEDAIDAHLAELLFPKIGKLAATGV